MLSVVESLDFLKREGFPVVDSFVVDSVSELAGVCKKLGFPLVMKIINSEHKTDKGGVFTNVSSLKEALVVFNKLRKLSKSVLVQEQVKGIELVLGVKKDNVFGQVVMFGLGGVFIELFRDVSFRVCPIDRSEALGMINELKVSALIKGFRGKEGVNIDSLVDLIVKLSQVSLKHDIKELDVNPLFALGSKFSIVDARLEL